MKIQIHPHAIRFSDGTWMQRYDRRCKRVTNQNEAYLVKFHGSALMMAEHMGGTAVEIATPCFTGLPAPRTVGEFWAEKAI